MSANIVEFILRMRDESSQAIAALRSQVTGLGQAHTTAAKGAAEGQEAQGRFREALDETSGSASKLGAALGLVHPEAGALAMVVADAADGLVVMADGARAMGVSLGAVATLAAGVTAGLAALVIAVGMANREMELAEATAKVYHDTNVTLRDGLRELADAELEYRVALGELTAGEAAQITARTEAQRSVEDYAESLRDQRDALKETAESAEFWASLDGGLGWVDAMMGWSDSAAAAREQMAILDRSVESFAETAKQTAEVKVQTIALDKEETENKERLTVAVDRQAEALALLAQARDIEMRGLSAEAQAVARAETALTSFISQMAATGVTAQQVTPALEQLAAELDQAMVAQETAEGLRQAEAEWEAWMPSLNQGTTALEAFYGALEQLVPGSTLSDLESLAAEVERLTAAFEEGKLSPEAYSAAMAAAGQAQASLQGVQADSRAGAAAGVISSVAGGSSGLMSMAASAGPQAAVVVAVVSLIQAIGDGLVAELGATLAELVNVIPDLPGHILSLLHVIVNQFLPALLEAVGPLIEGILLVLAPGLVETLADPQLWIRVAVALAISVGQILLALVEFVVKGIGTIADILGRGAEILRTVFSKEFWVQVAQALADAVREAFSPAGRERMGEAFAQGREAVGDRVGGWFKEGLVGSFDQGSAYVPRTGLAVVHKGERIDSTGGGRGRSAPTVIVNFPAGMVLGTAAEVQRVLTVAVARARVEA